MNNKIVIAGGTGFIGQYLRERFRAAGDYVVVVSRTAGDVQWADFPALCRAVDGSTAVINLAGKSVDCRYNDANKTAILQSRIESTQALGAAIGSCAQPPELWINSSTATIYRHAEDQPMTERTGELGDGFSVSVARRWEDAFFSCKPVNTRQIALRMAIVLGKGGGVIKPFMNLVKFGLGGRQGNGKQMFSWIHIADVYNIVRFLTDHTALSGIYNCAAPDPVSNEVLMQTLRRKMHVKFGLPSPAWLLEMGALLIKTETELILKSRWVLPEKLSEAGFQFEYGRLDATIGNILGDR